MNTRVATLLVLGFALSAGGCQKKTARPTIAPPPVVQPVPVSPPPVPVPDTWPELPLPPSRLPAPPEPPLPRYFREAEAAFQSSKYPEAIRLYERHIKEDPVTQYKDAAMFKLGIAHSLACTTPECRVRSLERSEEQLKRLMSTYPKSPYSAEARVILGLQADIDRLTADVKSRDERIKKLTDELERLKKIDLERQPTKIKK